SPATRPHRWAPPVRRARLPPRSTRPRRPASGRGDPRRSAPAPGSRTPPPARQRQLAHRGTRAPVSRWPAAPSGSSASAETYPISEDVEHRHGRVGGDAARQVAGDPGVARPQRVAPAAVLPAGPLHLLGGMHREGAGPFQPALVARAPEQLQERISVAGRAVTEAGALDQ